MKKTIEAVKKLNQDFPRPQIELEISEPYDTDLPWDFGPWPNVKKAGVYIFANEKNEVVYIGKASSSLGARLSAYWCKGKNGETESKDWKSEGVKWVYTIGLPNDRSFEAASIEEFLINQVKPTRNTNSK